MFLTCSNFIQPEHPGIKSTGQGVQEYAVNHVLHHWRDIEAEHLHGSFARIQEEELRTTFYHNERFVDFIFERLRSWAALLLDVKVPLSAEAAEWWTLIAERPRDCLLQLANSSANDALRICGKGTILEEQARENFASADTWNSVCQAVIRAAVESGEVAFAVQMYQDSIRLLNNVNASGPLLVEFGFLHINSTRDLEAARTVFDQALNSESTGWP
ncbi:hypothetical protein K4K56_010695 [Colletotrichum sp. SAR 10_98]|nr:hypothetical protein K4K56_010695 [Colletotrichum sp. SAR 10_98]